MVQKLFLALIVLVMGFDRPAEAHDIYSRLTDTWGNSCCNDTDCRPAPYRITPAGVRMLVDGDWIEVPGHTIQYRALLGDTGESGGGHWCGRAYQKVDDSIFQQAFKNTVFYTFSSPLGFGN